MVTAAEIIALMAEERVSAAQIAHSADISESTLSHWFNGRTKELRPSVVDKILDCLGYELVVRKKRRK